VHSQSQGGQDLTTPGGTSTPTSVSPDDMQILYGLLGIIDITDITDIMNANGIIDPMTLVGMDDASISKLNLPKNQKQPAKRLNIGQQISLKYFKEYVIYQGYHQKPITDINHIDRVHFQDNRTRYLELQVFNTNVTSNQGTTTISNTNTSPLTEFRRGIKRSIKDYPELKDEGKWKDWYRDMKNVAHTHGVQRVLNSSYTPIGADDIALFQEENYFIYAVLDRNVKISQGKAYVREHENDMDGQTVMTKLMNYLTKSTKASLQASELLTYITTAKLGDGTWKGKAQEFILHWENKVREYNSLVPSAERMNKNFRRTLLENAVHSIEDLRKVKAEAEQYQARNPGSSLSYDQYYNLVLSSALRYDERFVHSRTSNTRRHAVHEHEIIPDAQFDSAYDDFPDFDIDSSIQDIHVYAAAQKFGNRTPTPNAGASTKLLRPRPTAPADPTLRLPRDDYMSLSESEKAAWSALPDKVKRLALNTTPPKELQSLNRPQSVFNTEVVENNETFHDTVTTEHHDPDSTLTDTNNEVHPGDIRKVMSHSYRHLNVHIVYRASISNIVLQESLVDRGANGGIAGNDVRVLYQTEHKHVRVKGIDNHEITNLPIVTAAGVSISQRGPVLVILNQYAYHPQHKTIHSAAQIEAYKNEVNDKSLKVQGGLQRIKTVDGYIFPLNIKSGLPYLNLRPPDDDELETLPQVILTSDDDWDPQALDHVYDITTNEWHDSVAYHDDYPHSNKFDAYGEYLFRTCSKAAMSYNYPDDHISNLDTCIHDAHLGSSYDACSHITYQHFSHQVHPQKPNYAALSPYLGYISSSLVEQTFKVTSQYGKTTTSTLLKRHFKSPFPALNVLRRNESVATDTVYSATPAIGSGVKYAQVYVGTTTLLCDVYPMKLPSMFVNTLEDNIRDRGAMNQLISDSASVEISSRVQDILRAYVITSWQSEPHQQQQNPFERRWQTIKQHVNLLLDRSGSPASTWLLCLQHVVYILNHIWNDTISDTPLHKSTGLTNDISPLLSFYWWQPVYYLKHESVFPAESREAMGRWVGVQENVGHAMTYKILTNDTNIVISRSNVRPATKEAPNMRAKPLNEDEEKDNNDIHHNIKEDTSDTPLNVIDDKPNDDVDKPNDDVNTKLTSTISTPDKFKHDDSENDKAGDKQEEGNKTDRDDGIAEQSNNKENDHAKVIMTDNSELIGRSFLLTPEADGQRYRATIVECIEEYENQLNKDPQHVKIRCSIDDKDYEQLMTYQEVMDHINHDQEEEIFWRYKRIVAHEGPLNQTSPTYQNSKYNIMVEWENGEITSEPLAIFAADDPVACAIYAQENGLLDVDGWKHLRRIAKNEKKLSRMANQAKLKSFKHTIKYKFGFIIPRDYNHAMELDKKYGTDRWKEAISKEMEQLKEYETFVDRGHHLKIGDKPMIMKGYKRIKTHLVFDVKHDGRHKARMVADGHLTDTPLESVYSGVVSLRGIRIVTFIAELNKMLLWATDIGNAYLEAVTNEKVYIIAGPEFGELEGHILVIYKALYGLKASGARWHERLADCLREMGFKACIAEPDIWMRRINDHYEYIAVYVDDLAIASKKPQEIIDILKDKYNFKLKGTGPIEYHLGMNYGRDKDGTLFYAPIKYIQKLMDSYKQMFGGELPMGYKSPLDGNDHPEIDESEFLQPDDIQKFQSLIGQAQWAISIGRFDIATSVMTLSSYRQAPRRGHLERIKRIFGYLFKMKDSAIRVRTAKPDYSGLVEPIYKWEYSVYGNTTEEIPNNIPEPLGNDVITTSYIDANLYHDMLTGRSVTGILHLLNQTIIDWYSKKQNKVATATYGSEFIAANTCVNQIIDLRNTLRYLGVPVSGKSIMFGDNKAVVDSSTIPHYKLNKRHIMLPFHGVREAIAAGYAAFFHINGEINPADIVSKHWTYHKVAPMLKAVLFCKGDTKVCIRNGENR